MDELVSRPAERDELARQLERLHPASYGWALACCGRRPREALEVLQDAYLEVLEGRARFGGRSSFRTWLFGVIRRTAARERRRERLRRLRLVGLPEGAGPRDPAPDAGEALVRSERAERLVAALSRLSRRQQEVLELVFYHEMTVEGASVVMGVSVGAARRHYDRAKRRLRALLQAEEP